MADNKWNLSIGKIEIKDEKIICEANDSYKNVFQKKYKTITDAKIGKEAEKILKKVWEKGKRVEEKINFLIKTEIADFFDAIANAESSTHTEMKEYRDTRDDVRNLFDIRIDEKLEITLKKDEVIESKVAGKLSVLNGGRKNRIWDIDLTLSEVKKLDLNNKYHILDLDPEEEWVQDYEIEADKIKAPLEIKEDIDVLPDTEEKSHTLILNKEHNPMFSIEISNTSEATITNIELVKEIADEFDNVKVIEDGLGKVDKGSGQLTWDIEELEAGQSTTLQFTARITPSGEQELSSGKIEVNYVIPEDTFTGLKVEYVDGYSDNIYYVDRDERDEEPDVWDCKFIFKNRSEYPLKIIDVDLKTGDYNTKAKVVDLGPQLDPDVILNPGEEWESEPWTVESEDIPTFGKNVQFSVVGDIINQASALVVIEPFIIPVLTLSGSKEFDTTEIASFKEAVLNATITINTSGKAPIDQFHIEDTIPRHFAVPETVSIKVEQKEVDTSDITIKYEPSEDIDEDRKMIIDVVEVLDHIGELDDETTIIIEYPLKAVKPAKDTKYEAPVLFQAITQEGSIIETYIEPKIAISVSHSRRRYSDGRVIAQGDTKGKYIISIIHKNRSDIAETNKVFEELIPPNFNLVSMEPEAERDDSTLTWTISNIDPDDEVVLTYTIEGTGDFKARDAQVSFRN